MTGALVDVDASEHCAIRLAGVDGRLHELHQVLAIHLLGDLCEGDQVELINEGLVFPFPAPQRSQNSSVSVAVSACSAALRASRGGRMMGGLTRRACGGRGAGT
eukprot:scaffold867_cov317-Prasinococcus_capsulatus_cf.AAC.2